LWEKLRTFFTAIDLDRLFEWKPLPIAETGQAVPRRTLRESLRLLCGTKVYTGYRALKKLLLYSPAAYLVFAVIMRAPEAWHHRRWVAVGALVLFSSIDEVVDRMFASHSPRVPQQCGALQAAGRSSS
ncbi:MAG TPA: hypothetical protein VM912_15845, partial [Terriglobales bacterium]|nr:hypothetical protein [Terriglobales bacterium]